jgi:hypothetical protein
MTSKCSRGNHLKKAFSLIPVFLCLSCGGQPAVTNLNPMLLFGEPKGTSFVDPDANFSSYRTFAVLPYSMLVGGTSLNAIAERQLAFYLRSLLELDNYKYVSTQDSADFVIAVNATNEYREHYVPPQTYQVPKWVPEKTVVSRTVNDGSINANGSDGSSASADYSSNATTSTTIPGYMTSTTQTTNGYIVGRFYPESMVFAYDRKSRKNIYQATASGVSSTHDVRVASQLLIIKCLKEIPGCSAADNSPCPLQSGRIGLRSIVTTTDGNNYWPAITNVVPNSPAELAGMEYGDFIISIDGVSMRNKDLAFYLCHIVGVPGTIHNFVLSRLGTQIAASVTMKSHSEVYPSK